jgi:S-adenosylmethionine decarboxylase
VLVQDESRSGQPGANLTSDNRTSMRLHALDAWVRDTAVLTDAHALREILRAGAVAGGATVVGEEFHVFPNRAVTGVLVLAQSHLSIHTWPEFALANVDLLSYGDVRADDVLRVICERLDVVRSSVCSVRRAVG